MKTKNYKSTLCVSLSHKDHSTIMQILQQVEMAEIRIDLIEPSKEFLSQIFGSHHHLIATCRSGKFTDAQRKQWLMSAIDNGAAYIDIEMDASIDFREEMLEYANHKKCKTILSYHNFDKTPQFQELEEITRQCFLSGANVAKISTHCHSKTDAISLLRLYEKFENLVAIGMGEQGKITRIASLIFGAPFTYVSSSKAHSTAEGQISFEAMDNLIKIILES